MKLLGRLANVNRGDQGLHLKEWRIEKQQWCITT